MIEIGKNKKEEQYQMNKILVTGGLGFVGSNLKKELESEEFLIEKNKIEKVNYVERNLYEI